VMLEGTRHLVFLEPEEDLREIGEFVSGYLQSVGAIPAQTSAPDRVGTGSEGE
jgi:hypothetical protein